MKIANFNVEGDKTVFTNANTLKIGNQFSFVYDTYTVIGFTKWNIMVINQDGKKGKFYAFDFENWANRGDIKIIK